MRMVAQMPALVERYAIWTPVEKLHRRLQEIGLESHLIEPVGYLDIYMTTLGYRIVPTVARVAPGLRLHLNRDEVDDAFEVPLAFLMSPENHKLHSRDWNGLTRTFYAMPYGERYIWGATAGILRNLYERVYQS